MEEKHTILVVGCGGAGKVSLAALTAYIERNDRDVYQIVDARVIEDDSTRKKLESVSDRMATIESIHLIDEKTPLQHKLIAAELDSLDKLQTRSKPDEDFPFEHIDMLSSFEEGKLCPESVVSQKTLGVSRDYMHMRKFNRGRRK